MRKMMLLGGVAAVVLTAAVLFLFMSSKKSTNDRVEVIIPTIQPAQNLQKPGNVLSYDGNFLRTLFPNDWEALPAVFKGGEEVAFRPKGMAVGDFIPSVYIIRFETNTAELKASQRAQFDKLSYKEVESSVGGVSAILLSGTYPFYTKNGKIINEPLQDSVYFVEYKGGLIIIRLRYPGEVQNKNTQEVFSYIADNIQWK